MGLIVRRDSNLELSPPPIKKEEKSLSDWFVSILDLFCQSLNSVSEFFKKIFYKVEQPTPAMEKIATVAKESLPKVEKEQKKELIKQSELVTLPMEQERTDQKAFRALDTYLKSIGALRYIALKTTKVDALDPTKILLPSVWKEILASMTKQAWLLAEPKSKQQPSQEFQDKIEALVTQSFAQEDYQFFENFYFRSHPELEQEIHKIDRWASFLGAATKASILSLGCLCPELFSPAALLQVFEESQIPYLKEGASALLWALALNHLKEDLGVTTPSFAQIKSCFNKILQKPHEFTQSFSKVFTKQTLMKMTFSGWMLYMNRHADCVARVVSSGIEAVMKSGITKMCFEDLNQEKLERFEAKQKSAARKAQTLFGKMRLGALGFKISTAALNSAAYITAKSWKYVADMIPISAKA